MSFTTIVSEGNLIPADLLAAIAAGEAEGQQPADFGFEKSRRLSDEIAAAWADARAYWEAFQRSLRRLRDDDPATTVTRERWVVPLLETLGYKLVYQPTAAVVAGRTYAISHRAGNSEYDNEYGPPVHIEGLRRSLDQRGPAGRPRLSPHALVQEYLWLSSLDYYRQLLRLVYRLLFLMVAEERRLIAARQKVKRQNDRLFRKSRESAPVDHPSS